MGDGLWNQPFTHEKRGFVQWKNWVFRGKMTKIHWFCCVFFCWMIPLEWYPPKCNWNDQWWWCHIMSYCLRIMSIQWESIHFYMFHSLIVQQKARFKRRGTCSVHFVTLHEVEGFQRIQDLFKTWSRHGHGPFFRSGTLSWSAASPHLEMMVVTVCHSENTPKSWGLMWNDVNPHPNLWHSKPDLYCYDTPSQTIWGLHRILGLQ